MNIKPGYYTRFKDYLLEKYGERVQKVTLDAGFTCPHRAQEGKGCLFCDSYGSGSGKHRDGWSLEEQLRQGIRHGKKRYKARLFLAYFQAFTNTYADIETLRQHYSIIRKFPEVTGLAVGTRPDCLTSEVLELLSFFAEDYEVWLELGIQTSNNNALEAIHRGHTWEDSVRAVEMARAYPLNICLHFIFGLPGDAPSYVIKAVQSLLSYGFHGIKLHNLYITTDSPLYELYRRQKVEVPSYSLYLQAVCDTIEILPQAVIIQRLIGEAPRRRLVAPHWSSKKSQFLEDVQQELIRRKSYQGIKAGKDSAATAFPGKNNTRSKR